MHTVQWHWIHSHCCVTISSSVQSLSHVPLFAIPWIAARQASLSITNSRSLPKPMPIESVMPCSNLILCCPLLLLPPIPPSMGSFPVSWLFNSGIGPPVSVFPMNIQGWFPLGLTDLIFLLSKGLSRVFSRPVNSKLSPSERSFPWTMQEWQICPFAPFF